MVPWRALLADPGWIKAQRNRRTRSTPASPKQPDHVFKQKRASCWSTPRPASETELTFGHVPQPKAGGGGGGPGLAFACSLRAERAIR